MIADQGQDRDPVAAAEQNSPRNLTDNSVAKYCQVSRATLWRGVKTEEHFPAPIAIATNSTWWKLDDLLAFEVLRERMRSVRRASRAALMATSGHDIAAQTTNGTMEQ